MLYIEFNTENMTETIYYFEQKLFEQPICYSLSECVNEYIGDLKKKIDSAIDDMCPITTEERVNSLRQAMRVACDLPPEEYVPISCLSLPREAEYRYQDYGVYRCFAATLNEYATAINADSLCRTSHFFFYVFGEDVVARACTGDFPNGLLLTPTGVPLTTDTSEENFIMPFKFLREQYMIKYGANISKYGVDYVEDLATVTLLFIIQNGLHLNKCRNCGRFFIPQSRSDEIYCNGIAPQTVSEDTKLSCKQYGTAHLWYDRIAGDTLLKLCRNVYTSKQMRVRRHPDIQAYADNFERFKRESPKWKCKYESGECTADEFKQWLEEQKARKT